LNRPKVHGLFRIDGANIWCHIQIGFAEAALGAHISVPTLESFTGLQIPAGTQTGSVFRIRGRGLPLPHGSGRGDQLVRVLVLTPTDLSDRERRLLKEFREQEAAGTT
jgi:molecular chaperone DnaJ